MPPTDYVEDYEEVTGLSRETHAKVVEAPEPKPAKKAAAKVSTKAKD